MESIFSILIVFDGQTNEPMAGAMITIKDLQGDAEPIFVFTDDKGAYFSELKPGADIFMKAQKRELISYCKVKCKKNRTNNLDLVYFINFPKPFQ